MKKKKFLHRGITDQRQLVSVVQQQLLCVFVSAGHQHPGLLKEQDVQLFLNNVTRHFQCVRGDVNR